jgi:hypothetical protein
MKKLILLTLAFLCAMPQSISASAANSSTSRYRLQKVCLMTAILTGIGYALSAYDLMCQRNARKKWENLPQDLASSKKTPVDKALYAKATFDTITRNFEIPKNLVNKFQITDIPSTSSTTPSEPTMMALINNKGTTTKDFYNEKIYQETHAAINSRKNLRKTTKVKVQAIGFTQISTLYALIGITILR